MKNYPFLAITASCAALLSICACSSDSGTNNVTEVNVDGSDVSITANSFEELPNCSAKREGSRASVKGTIYSCIDGAWEELDQYDSFDDLPNCSAKREGNQVFVGNVAYVCDDGEWVKESKRQNSSEEDDDYTEDDGDSSKTKGSSDSEAKDSSSSKAKSSSSSQSGVKPSSSSRASGSATPQRVGPVSQYGQLQAGTNSSGKGQIYGSCKGVTSGNEVVVQGMSLFWSMASGYEGANYWTSSYVDEFVKRHNIQLIRGAMGVDGDWGAGNYFSDSIYYQGLMDDVVAAAIRNDIYVIIDYHSHTADNDASKAKKFFERMAKKWGSYDNVIFEIFNEPTTQSWSTIKSYANQVIPVIRQYSDNLIVVGNPSWSSEPNVANNSPISDANVAYTFHFYAGLDNGSGHETDVQGANAVSAMNNGLSVFVTEWGNSGPSGDGTVSSSRSTTWYNWMKTHKLSGANWAVSSKSEKASYFSGNASVSGTWSYSTSGSWVNSNIFANLPTSYTACSGGTMPSSSSSTSPNSSASILTGSDALGGDGMFANNGSVPSSWSFSTPKSTYGYGVASGTNDDGDAVLAFWSPGPSHIDYGYEIQARHRVTLKQGYSYQLYVVGYGYDDYGAASRYVDMSVVDTDYYDSYVGWSFDIEDASPYLSTTYCHTYATDSYAEFHIDGGVSAGGFDVLEVLLIETPGC